MTKDNQDTTMGGSWNVFRTTHWSDIQDAKTLNEDKQRLNIDNLIRKYWKPVYFYLKRKGYNNEDAKDLTQAFFHEIVLGRELLQQADQSKGRFRTFLLTALDNFVASVYRKETAKKRKPDQGLIQLDANTLPNIPTGQLEETPEQIFNYVWASNLLDQVISNVRNEYYVNGMESHWEVFRLKVLMPIFEDTKAPSLTEICSKYNIENESRASNMIVTVKRRFSVVLKRQLRQFVQSDSEIENEYNELIEILSKSKAG